MVDEEEKNPRGRSFLDHVLREECAGNGVGRKRRSASRLEIRVKLEITAIFSRLRGPDSFVREAATGKGANSYVKSAQRGTGIFSSTAGDEGRVKLSLLQMLQRLGSDGEAFPGIEGDPSSTGFSAFYLAGMIENVGRGGRNSRERNLSRHSREATNEEKPRPKIPGFH